MREDKKKITVEYNISNKLVLGYYPNDVKYPDKTFEDTQGVGYLEIDQDSWKIRPKQAVVNSDIDGIIEYQKSSDELLGEARKGAIASRENYLKDSIWYYEFDTMPQDIKDKRILARAEINQIEQESEIDNIVVDFS